MSEPIVINRHHHRGVGAQGLYIGRGGPFGNPFEIGRDGTREQVIEKFEIFAHAHPDLLAQIKDIPAEAILVCSCKPLACHGDVIVRLWKEMHA